MRPPPGLMAHPAPPPVGKGAGKLGAGPLADSLAETRRRVEDIEAAIKSYENDNEAQVQIETQAHQIAVMEAKFALLEAEMKAYEDQSETCFSTWNTQAHQIAAMEAKIVLLENQMQFENHASFAICNEMKEQMTHMENRIISLEAASNSASLASSTAADYEVLQNPALLNPKSSGL